MVAAGNHLPYSYRRFISSEMFTLRVGPLLKPFCVHKQLLANLSSELRRYAFNEMGGHGEGMEMTHVSEETMGQFLEFCYTGDYSQLVNESTTSDEADEGEAHPPLQQLLPNAELYILGDTYNIQGLKNLAFAKVEKGIRAIGYNTGKPEVKIFVQLFKRAFEGLPEREVADPLLELLAKYTAWNLETFREEKSFLSLFVKNDRMDFIALILSSLQEGGVPWS